MQEQAAQHGEKWLLDIDLTPADWVLKNLRASLNPWEIRVQRF
jgi:hypothetical protein